MLIFFIIFGVLLVLGFIYTLIYQKRLKKIGIEAEGVIRIDIVDSVSADEFFDKHTEHYVKYINENGKEIEATIANPKKDMNTGDRIKIKYLPDNPKYAYFIEKIK